MINCDRCNASKYAGFSKCANDVESCLLFDEVLEEYENNTTKPCDKCGGKYFKEDEW